VSETALRVGLAGNPEKVVLEVLRWRNLLLIALRDPHRDGETASPKRIESCFLGFVEQEELAQREQDSLMRSVVLLAHILLGHPMHQSSSLEREDGREKHLQGQHFSWPGGVQLPVVPSNRQLPMLP